MLPQNIKIIIADDDRTTRSALRLLLMENRYIVIGEAMDGEKAIELCLSLNPNIAFIDINMPKVDGHLAAQQIRQRNPKTGVIMISSLPTLSNVRQAMESGAGGFVVKPFNASKVVEAINNCMKSQ